MTPTFEDEEAISDELEDDFELVTESSYNPRLDFKSNELNGFVDEKEALRQDIYVHLGIERYQYSAIFPDNVGVEFSDLIGEEPDYVEGELQLRIEDCLLSDDRIDSLSDFDIEYLTEKGTIHVTFTVHSIYGDVLINKTFNAEEVI